MIETEGSIQLIVAEQFTSEEWAELLRQLELPATLTSRMESLLSLDKGKYVELPGDRWTRVVRDEHCLTFVQTEQVSIAFHCEEVDSVPTEFTKNELYLDLDKLKGELRLRPWQTGDRIAPIGMEGTQLISDIVRRSKIDASTKEALMILHDDEHIHWCIGLKIGRHAVADKHSSSIIRCWIS